MLLRLAAQGYKSLVHTEIRFTEITLLLGPMGAGKSTLLRAIMALSHMATSSTVAEALAESNDGDASAAFGLTPALDLAPATLILEADIALARRHKIRYRLGAGLQPETGRILVTDEYLSRLTLQLEPVRTARIERDPDRGRLKVRRKAVHSPPWIEDLGLSHALLSDPRLSGAHYPDFDKLRAELAGWTAFRFSQFRPTRHPAPGQTLDDVGPSGEWLLPFLRRLERESPADLASLQEGLVAIVEGAEDLCVTLDERFGVLDLQLRIHGIPFPASALPEGVLRVIALLATVVNPWSGKVITIDEPENGLDPQSCGLIGEVLLRLAMKRGKQLIISTHSPWLCEEVMTHRERFKDKISLLHVQNKGAGTVLSPFEGNPLFSVKESSEAMRS